MSGETEILCWTHFWFRQRNYCICESCWVKRILTKRPSVSMYSTESNGKIENRNWFVDTSRHKYFWHFQTFPISCKFSMNKNSIIWCFSISRTGNCHFISRQFNKIYTTCMRDLIFETPIFSWFADFSVIRRASIQVSEARKFLSLESVFFKFLFYVNAV